MCIRDRLFDRALLNRNGVMDIWNMAHVEDGEKYYIRKEYTAVSYTHLDVYKRQEIHTANMLGIAVIDANQIKRHLEYEEKRQERAASDYAKLHKCKHCYERRLCSLMGYENCCTASACTAAYKRAYECALGSIRERQET